MVVQKVALFTLLFLLTLEGKLLIPYKFYVLGQIGLSK